MKIYMSIFCFLLSICQVYSQNSPTEICIIGNSHNTSTFFNAQILDSILCRIRPDLILIELDSSFFTSDFKFDTISRPYLLNPEKSSQTIIGTNKYCKNHIGIDIRPFDITGRNDFYSKNDFFNKQNLMYTAIFKYANDIKFTDHNLEDFELLSQSLSIVNGLTLQSLREFNSESMSGLTYLQNTIYLDKAIDLVESTDSLKMHVAFSHLQKDFWYKRNNTMLKNIEVLSGGYKRIVILTGNLHKYGLDKGLEKSGKYKIKEFWEY